MQGKRLEMDLPRGFLDLQAPLAGEPE
jgi:hypothetical protein